MVSGKSYQKPKRISFVSILVVTVSAIATLVVLAAISSSMAKPEPIGSDMHSRDVIVRHAHAHLTVKLDGKSIIVPANIGIDSVFYRDHTLDIYGSINPPASPLHTHDADGVIHIESTAMRDYKLGQFLDIWGLDFGDNKTPKMAINGIEVDTTVYDYRKYILQDGAAIVLEIN